jgi:hypothetical protein
MPEPTWRLASRRRLSGIHCLTGGRTLGAVKMAHFDYLPQGCRHRDIVGVSRPTNRALPKVASVSVSRSPLPICGRPLSRKGKRWGRCCAWSDAVICPAFDAAGRQPPACMGVRGPGPDYPKHARSTVKALVVPAPLAASLTLTYARPKFFPGAAGGWCTDIRSVRVPTPTR